jgi:DNA-binding XRE family transcriptional regulator
MHTKKILLFGEDATLACDGKYSKLPLYTQVIRLFGSRVREARIAKNMTQTQLAKEAGMHQGNLSRLEKGEHMPTVGTLRRVAIALDADFSDLI